MADNTPSHPGSGPGNPLIPALVTLTVATGMVDALSYLELDRVFVANMTGNIVFIAFALVDAENFSVVASLIALAAFMVGSIIGGQLGHRLTQRTKLFVAFTCVEVVLLLAATLATLLSAINLTAQRYGLIVLLALAMGVQNAGVRKLAVPNLTTTVLTMAVTGIAADGRVAGGTDSKVGIRGLSIAAMLGGAVFGAFLIEQRLVTLCVGVATALVAVSCALVITRR
ncbi:YoaK family protein [Pseudonocardia sp. CA-142604]|uniref:YoaK family protein n=1 Tax=Pseudonocardia sp. CA-142604 TaxID=3240024 RepID=UPI003D914736